MAGDDSVAEDEEYLQKALALDPDNPEVLVRLASIRLAQNRPEEALVYSRRAIEVQPSSIAAHYLCGEALEKMGREREALQAYWEVLSRADSGEHWMYKAAAEVAAHLKTLIYR